MKLLLCVVILIVLSGCGLSEPTPTPVPTLTPEPTSTKVPTPSETATPTLTSLPSPTATWTPAPTYTQAPPTFTEKPAATATFGPYTTDDKLYATNLRETIDLYDVYLPQIRSELLRAQADPALYLDIDWQLNILKTAVVLQAVSRATVQETDTPERFLFIYEDLKRAADQTLTMSNAIADGTKNDKTAYYDQALTAVENAIKYTKSAKTKFNKLNPPTVKKK